MEWRKLVKWTPQLHRWVRHTALAIACGAAGFSALVWATSAFQLKPADLAAWVQALVSVAAIVVGAIAIYWQVGRQAATERRRKLDDDVRILTVMAHTTFVVRSLGEAALEAVLIEQPWFDYLDEIDQHWGRLADVPLVAVPDWRVDHLVTQVGLSCARLKQRREFYKRRAEVASVAKLAWEAELNALTENCAGALTWLRRALLDRGSDIPAVNFTINKRTYSTTDFGAVPRFNRR